MMRRLEALSQMPKRVARYLFGRAFALSDLYFGLFSRAFAWEHRGVLNGSYRYESLDMRSAANRYLLRRNTHRLEKGLLMRPRRDTFAVGYIEQTVNAYERCTRAALPCDDGELQWAHDVLAEYFAVSGPHPVVDRLRVRFAGFDHAECAAKIDSDGASKPYIRDLTEAVIGYDDFLRLSRRRRSVRWFKPDPVPRELIDRAITAGVEAPSACNRQPFHFRVFDDPELVKVVSQLPMGTRGFAHNFPAVVVVVGELRAYFHPRDRHLIYIDGSLASMGFMLALETLGLSSCPINWPEIPARERQMAELLGLEPDQRPVMLIAVGYPDDAGAVAYSHKLPLSRIRRYNRE